MAFKTKEILVRGTGGVGKTLYADALTKVAEDAGLKVELSDHALFTSHINFEKDLERTRLAHRESNADISIIVINDRGPDLQVNFTQGVPHRLALALFPGMFGSDAHTRFSDSKIN